MKSGTVAPLCVGGKQQRSTGLPRPSSHGRPPAWRISIALLAALLFCSAEWAQADAPAEPAEAPAEGWRPLFDGQSLDGWKKARFGGDGDVEASDGQLSLGVGVTLTGITWQGDFPKSNYEIRLEAKRVEGIDFFCGLTFPVGESHCSFIVGGWAGAVVGLSSIDGLDASENETTSYRRFEKDRWYAIRVRVTDDRIAAWIDDEQVVDQDIRNRRITTRSEVDLSKPLGLSAWQTKAVIRSLEWRPLETAAGDAPAETPVPPSGAP